MKKEIIVNNEKIIITIEKRQRKSIKIEIKPPGIINVIIPCYARESDALFLVKNKSKWIIDKLKEVREAQKLKFERKLINGEKILYLGREYEIEIKKQDKKIISVNFQSNKFHILTFNNDEEMLKKAINEWYKKQAQIKIVEIVDHYKKYLDVEPNSVKAKKQKKRWGTCTSTGNIYINYRIIMAPEKIIDYLVVHELCHMVHMNHSKDFWGLVEKIIPDYKDRKEWLKKNGIELYL
jgi:predicted metal-dependent hydrolase